MNPSSVLNAWMSLQRLNMEIAVRKTDFQVIYFKEAFNIGSKGASHSESKTCFKSHSGTSLISGGLVLKTPFKSLIISGC